MWRGTTPMHIFTLPVGVKLTDFSAVFITYSQNGETILEKTEADLTPTETGFTVTLTQADTLLFTQGPVKIQLRAKKPTGEAVASDIISSTAIQRSTNKEEKSSAKATLL